MLFFAEKSGLVPNEVINLAKYVKENCTNLEVEGIMTIGQYGYNVDDGPNPDFICLKKCREELCQTLNLDWKTVNLSMGMSTDFEHAVII